MRFVSSVSGCFGGFLSVAGIRINLSLYKLICSVFPDYCAFQCNLKPGRLTEHRQFKASNLEGHIQDIVYNPSSKFLSTIVYSELTSYTEN